MSTFVILTDGSIFDVIFGGEGEWAPEDYVSWVEDWPSHAACRDSDPDSLFVQGAAQNRAKVVCGGCPVRSECLADALDNRIEFGVWGGMTERERRALLRRRPEVVSWRRLLEDAREDYDRKPFVVPPRQQPVESRR